MERKRIAIIGGGPAGLMAADQLSCIHHVSVYDKEKNVGQKFLVAGKGGFNLTNNLPIEELAGKYFPAGFMNKALNNFDTNALRQWLSGIGIPTFVGSSGRVFPQKSIRPIDVLNGIRAKLLKQGVEFHTQHEFIGFDNHKRVTFKISGREIVIDSDYVIFALGGASWPVTGSNGSWRTIIEVMGIKTNPFQASNCGINISWPHSINQHHAGKPIKNIKLYTSESEALGELIVTRYGLEGNAVYPVVPFVRKMIANRIPVNVYIDFKPLNTEAQLLEKLKGKDVKTKDYAQIFNLTSVQLALLKAYSDKESFLSATEFVNSLKRLPIPVNSLRPIEEAISTIGGIDLGEVNDDFSLKKYPWIYTIGEMLDWDAPTGGFLLQGCFSMGNYAAKSILEREK